MSRSLGVPYQGSKNAIAREIVSILPRGKRFVDLFAGGCAVTHAAILSGKYETFLLNDIHGAGVELFLRAMRGEYANERRWISHEDFDRLKETDPFVQLCWSFGNNGVNYLYNPILEAYKKGLHYAVVLKDNTLMDTIDEETRAKAAAYSRPEELQHVERLSRLQHVESLNRLQHVESLNRHYSEVPCGGNGDVVYADPPYAGTQKYRKESFDHAAFWRWVETRDFPVFVSEYHAPKGFSPIWTRGKNKLFSGTGTSGKAQEFVFVADRFADRFQGDLFLSQQERK